LRRKNRTARQISSYIIYHDGLLPVVT